MGDRASRGGYRGGMLASEVPAPSPVPSGALTHGPTLTPEAVRILLRECVTVIKPGETLIVRVPWATPVRTVYELGRVLHEQAEMAGAGFHTLVVPAAEIGAGEGPQDG
jgi:hypothetical protein